MKAPRKTNRRQILKTAAAIPLCGASLIAQQADAGVDSEELTVEEKTKRIFSTLTPEELQSITDTVENMDDSPSVFHSPHKLKGNAGLALMLVYSFYRQDQDEPAKRAQVA